MTKEARDSFVLQGQAESARAAGDTAGFQRLQTAAAIEMGKHEQGNLQKMWDSPAMLAFAKVNATLMQASGGRVAIVRPDIYIGTNPMRDNGSGFTIPAPRGSEDLSKLDNRIAIARNGFNALNAVRQAGFDRLLDYHQGRLAASTDVMQPRSIKASSQRL